MNENILTFPGLQESIAKLIKEEVIKAKEESFVKVFDLHIRALSCHCECLGMNAQNCYAVNLGKEPPYRDIDYIETMKKWDLVNDEGKPII